MIDPALRRLTVGLAGDAAHIGEGRDDEASSSEKLKEFGLDQIFERAASEGKKAGMLLSTTDRDLARRKEFSEKDTASYWNTVVDNRECFERWVSESRIAVKCHKGKKPESPNQDSFSIVLVEDDFELYCIFDGHGPFGHDVSEFCRCQVVAQFLNRRGYGLPPKEFSPKKALIEAFVSTQKLLEAKANLDSSMSGSTCTVAYHEVQTSSLWVAHAGDSRAIISNPGDNSAPTAKELTVDHKPNLPEEKARIEKMGGRVVFDGYFNHRVFSSKGLYPGLNMSRALGDVVGHREAGLTAEPDVIELKLTAESQLLLLCTDGVWEFIGNDEVLRLALHGKKLSEISPKDLERNLTDITKASFHKWMVDSDNEISDDITGIAVVLQAR